MKKVRPVVARMPEKLGITPRELDPRADCQRPEQSRDRRKTLCQRKHRQDPFQPPVRQAERPAPNPGRAVGKRVGTDSLIAAPPPDVRKVSDLPAGNEMSRGYAPENWAQPRIRRVVLGGASPTAHQAAEPRRITHSKE